MPPKKRKINFYYFRSSNSNISAYDGVSETLSRINALAKPNRKYQLPGDKFMFAETIHTPATGNLKVIFKSASNQFRPPLLDGNNLNERPNPKHMTEGDRILTHCLMKHTTNGLLVAHESYGKGLNIRQIISYLSLWSIQSPTNPFHITYETLLGENFLDELNNLDRTQRLEIKVNKSILGSQYLDFTDTLQNSKDTIKIVATSEYRRSLTGLAVDILSRMNAGSSPITSISIEGKNQENNVVKFNNEVVQKTEYISVSYDVDTGELISRDVVRAMGNILATL